ncbi:MAG: HAD family hydrolase [Candidatus Jordarchaeum sp.]|uniref:HAD family hydrolase n=1 Tax=Candidatus Jordarchaeum sp. TaxID=2823881 RepID=UPI004048F11F
MRKRIKSIIFDLDGTLIDVPDGDFFDRLLVESLVEIGCEVPSREQRDQLWESGKDYQKILKSWGVRNLNDFWKAFDRRDLEARQRLMSISKIKPYEDVVVLEGLAREFSLGIVTNTPMELAFLELDTFNLTQYFDSIVALGTIEQKNAKPEAYGILKCIKELNSSPRDSLVVGDKDSDIIAGVRAGTLTAIIVRSRIKTTVKADFIINNLYELIEVL